MTSFYTESELKQLGFKCIGKDCKISRFARFYSIENISLGNNVRIDDFCILSGNIKLGNNIHISAYVALYGSKGIVLEDYTGISPNSVVYSAMDDFSGEYLIGPIHPEHTTHVTGGPVVLKKYVQIGTNTVIFPNLTIGEGTVTGACSLILQSLDEWGIYAGIPAKRIKERTQVLKKFIY